MVQKKNMPRHIAVILDGNGRWAQERHLPRTMGHREGVKRVREITQAASDLGIEVLTFYVFSSENWSRPALEVKTLMHFLSLYLGKELPGLDKKNVRVKVIGRRGTLPKAVLEKITAAEATTKDNTGLTLVLAINYGSRQEICDGMTCLLRDCRSGKVSADEVTEAMIDSYLYTAGLPDPDLLIRTSGEQRISNFLLWQLSYAELYFPQKYWPDFRKDDLLDALDVYAKRRRRFGGIEEKGPR